MKLSIYDNLKRRITHIVETFNLNVSAALTGRPRKITKLDALTLSLYQHKSTRITKRSVYEDLRHSLRCSYKTLVVSMNKAGVLAKQILELIMCIFAKEAHPIKYTDATDIPVCLKKNADKHKTMSGLSGFGRSSKGLYYGLKLHLTSDLKRKILSISLTPGNTGDGSQFMKLNKKLKGIFIADAGYVSEDLEKEFYIEN